jgi:hypothetical protein
MATDLRKLIQFTKWHVVTRVQNNKKAVLLFTNASIKKGK